jgi:hypothetical protein
MSKVTRKNWTRNLALARLKEVNEALDDLEKLAEGGGKIPVRFRKRLATASVSRMPLWSTSRY